MHPFTVYHQKNKAAKEGTAFKSLQASVKDLRYPFSSFPCIRTLEIRREKSVCQYQPQNHMYWTNFQQWRFRFWCAQTKLPNLPINWSMFLYVGHSIPHILIYSTWRSSWGNGLKLVIFSNDVSNFGKWWQAGYGVGLFSPGHSEEVNVDMFTFNSHFQNWPLTLKCQQYIKLQL